MKTNKQKMTLSVVAIAIAAVFAISGCGGGGGASRATSADTSKDTVAKATISGVASIEGLDSCSDVVIVAEKVSGGVTRTVQKAIDAAASGERTSARVAADDSGVFMTATDSDCAYSLSVTPDTYSVSAYKEDTVGAQPRIISARSAQVVTVNFELVATGKVAGTATLGIPGADIVIVYLDGTSFVAFAAGNGAYEISNVPVGTYTIKFVRGSHIIASNAGVAVAAGATTNNSLTSISVECVEDIDCDDSNDYTADTCSGGGAVGATCAYAVVECINDADCNDSIATTIDKCKDPYLALAVCTNAMQVNGGTVISADTTWAASNSPVTVTGQILVDAGVTLTIEPGVVVQFTYPAVGGDMFQTCCSNSSSLGGIRVNGMLIADGTSSDPITMTLHEDDQYRGGGYWGGIYIAGGATASIQYVNMQYPAYAIQSDNSLVTINNVNITDVGDIQGGNYSASYHMYAKTADGWREVGVQHYDLNYNTRRFDLSGYLPDADGEYKVRIEQVGMHAAHIESIDMMADQSSFSPVSAYDVASGQDVAYKVIASDNDVLDAHLKTFDVKFDSPQFKASRLTVNLKAREEGGEVARYGKPFLFPRNSGNETVSTASSYSYTLGSAQGAPMLDGMISGKDNLRAPAFAENAAPMSGHPAGIVYGYTMNDSRNLYLTLDFTTDNTFDGAADYAAVYVRVGDTYKKFTLSEMDNTYGVVGFNYTGSVNYQHKIYEFAIPLSEIGSPAGGSEVSYVVEAYGTSSLFDSAVTMYYALGPVSITNLSISFDNSSSGYVYGINIYQPGGAVTLNNVSVDYTGSSVSGYGIQIYYASDVTINGLDISGANNSTGLYAYNTYGTPAGSFSCTNCFVNSNPYSGGIDLEWYNTVTLSNVESNNNGGNGIYLYRVNSSTITNSDFSFNDNYGMNLQDVGATITNTRVEGNCSYGIYNYYSGYGGAVNISGSNIIDNNSYGLYNSGGTMNLTGSFVSGNYTDPSGTVDTTLVDSNQKFGLTTVASPSATIKTATGMPSGGTGKSCSYSY